MTSKGRTPHVNFPPYNHRNGEVYDRPEDIDAQSSSSGCCHSSNNRLSFGGTLRGRSQKCHVT